MTSTITHSTVIRVLPLTSLSDNMGEEEERRLLDRFDRYCEDLSLTVSFTSPEKKKLIQMIQMLEKLREGNPVRYEGTLRRMGLEKILEQNNTDISIFDAILAFYGAAKSQQIIQIKASEKDKEHQMPNRSSSDLFEDIKKNEWAVVLRLLGQQPQAAQNFHPKYGLPLHLLCSTEVDYCPTLEAFRALLSLFPSGLSSLCSLPSSSPPLSPPPPLFSPDCQA
jgi:hypothetical protein